MKELFHPIPVVKLQASGACKQPIHKHSGAVVAKQQRQRVFRAAPSPEVGMARLDG